MRDERDGPPPGFMLGVALVLAFILYATVASLKSECRVPLPPLPLALPDAVQFAPL